MEQSPAKRFKNESVEKIFKKGTEEGKNRRENTEENQDLKDRKDSNLIYYYYIEKHIDGGNLLKLRNLAYQISNNFLKGKLKTISLTRLSSGEFITVFYQATQMIKEKFDSLYKNDSNPESFYLNFGEDDEICLKVQQIYDNEHCNFYYRLNEEDYHKLAINIISYFRDIKNWQEHIDLIKFSRDGCLITAKNLVQFKIQDIDFEKFLEQLNKFFFVELFWKPMERFMLGNEKTKVAINFAESIRLLQKGDLDFKQVFNQYFVNDHHQIIYERWKTDENIQLNILQNFYGKLSISFRDYVDQMLKGESKGEIEEYKQKFSEIYENKVTSTKIKLRNICAGEFFCIFYKLQETLHSEEKNNERKFKLFTGEPSIEIELGQTKLFIIPRNEYQSERILCGKVLDKFRTRNSYTYLYQTTKEYFKDYPGWEKEVIRLFLRFSSRGIPVDIQDISRVFNLTENLSNIVDILNEFCFLALFWEPMQWFDSKIKFYEIVIDYARSLKLIEERCLDFIDVFQTDSGWGLFQMKWIKENRRCVFEMAKDIGEKYNKESNSSKNTLEILEYVFGKIEKSDE